LLLELGDVGEECHRAINLAVRREERRGATEQAASPLRRS
jgi:hypothetical protein